MKYLKVLFLLIFLNVSSVSASMLLGANSYCIEDFYIKTGSFYYLRSDNNTWYSTTNDTWSATVKPNYMYDSITNQCNPNMSYILGMQETEYNFLLGIVGLLFGAVFMFFTTQIFTTVGGRR